MIVALPGHFSYLFCILVPKPDGTYRMCTDYRKVNNFSKTDYFPIPRMDDCIDKIETSKYITKFDLLKGFWQIPLTERAKEVSAFVTPDGLYHYKVMPFGMKKLSSNISTLNQHRKSWNRALRGLHR